MVDILIEGGIVMTMNPDRKIFGDGAIAVQDDRIIDVGKTEDLKAKYPAPKRVIDAKNKLVMPGLIDAHTHLQMAFTKGIVPGNYGYGNPWIQRIGDTYMRGGRMNEEYMYLSTLITCAEMIRGGSTTFIDCGGATPVAEKAVIKATGESGMRGILGLATEDIFDWPGYKRSEEQRKMYGSTEDNIRRVEDLIQKYNNKGEALITLWPNIRQMQNASDALCRGVKELADKYKVGVKVHANVMRPMVESVVQAWGKTPIMRLYDSGALGRNTVIAHATHMPGEDLAAVKETDTTLVHCVFTSMGLGYGACLFGNFPAWLGMGINIALGTDGVPCGNHKDMVRVINATFLVNKEGKFDCNLWPPETVVEMATLNGAKAVLMEKEIGSLEPGKKADVILFDLTRPEWVPVHKYNLIENLVLSATGDSVDTTIINGRVVMEGHEIKTFDEKQVVARVQEIGRGSYLEGLDFLKAEKPYPENMPPLW